MKWAEQQESGCICCPKKSKSYDKTLKQYTSRKSITGNPTLTASALLRERQVSQLSFNRYRVSVRNNYGCNVESGYMLQEEINIGDNQYNKLENGSGSGKGIREVLINLHDQFEELNT